MLGLIWKQGWSREPSTVALWLWLFSMARHDDVIEGEETEWAGQATITEEQAANALCVGIKTVRKSMSELVDSNFISVCTVGKKKANKNDVITVNVHGYSHFSSCMSVVGDSSIPDKPVAECHHDSCSKGKDDTHVIVLKNGDTIDKEKFIAFWNRQMEEAHSVIPRINSIMGMRAIRLRTAAERFGKHALLNAVIIASKSPFLNGENNNAWTAKVDWVLKADNMQKIIDGNYSHNLKRDNYEEEMLRRLNKESYD